MAADARARSKAALEELGEGVLRQVLDSQAKTRSSLPPHQQFYEDLMGFIHAVRWREPWIVGMLVFHVVVAILVLATRRHHNVQMVLFIAICALVYSMSYVNPYAAANWRQLGFTQNYFDSKGLFLSVMVGAPLLCILFFQMLYALSVAVNLLVKVKRAELRARAREAAQAGGSGGGEAPAAVQNGDAHVKHE